jgi:hypothetical protein
MSSSIRITRWAGALLALAVAAALLTAGIALAAVDGHHPKHSHVAHTTQAGDACPGPAPAGTSTSGYGTPRAGGAPPPNCVSPNGTPRSPTKLN